VHAVRSSAKPKPMTKFFFSTAKAYSFVRSPESRGTIFVWKSTFPSLAYVSMLFLWQKQFCSCMHG
jgi:hypothetical protein